MRVLLTVAALVWLGGHPYADAQQKVDLSEISICLDPGHGLSGSGYANPGAYGYTETEKVLSVAFHLKSILEQTGVDTVLLTRTRNDVDISLTQRTAMANNANTDWFLSIHSNASSNTNTNYVIVLIEERRQYSDNRVSLSDSRGLGLGEAYWKGTADVLATIASDKIAKAYRTTNSGMRLDWTFYGGTNGGSTLGVLRTSLMPALLTEGAFHTNPTQNLRNMNDQYRRTEAKALWMSFLDYYGVPRPPIRTLLGIIRDKSTNAPLNDAVAELNSQRYKTNAYYDTFRYWQMPDTSLGNGIYYFENLPAGNQTVRFSKEGYRDTTVTIAVSDTFFTFFDVSLSRVTTSAAVSPQSAPLQFSLEQNFPNPFNPSTVISFTLPQAGRVRLEVLNLLGEPVATLIDEEREAGTHQVTWNGTNQNGNTVPSGVYFYKLHHGSNTLTRRMVFVR
ncbi:MAG TPA: N-acetylmuramoyl-L-alanine amidase [Bacteroidota bacterium]|nr:N-acetylmuramoyl-L-alanine amidase [Bacteroidota bacterium]